MASLYFKYGAMNCGKSTQALQVIHNYEERGMKVLVVKPKIDTKGNDEIVSRLGISRKVDLLLDRNEKISLYPIYQHDAIVIDESQFLTKKQVDDLLEIVSFVKIPILCFGIRVDSNGNGFEGSIRLLEVAHNLDEIKNICSCGKKATMNLRKVNGEIIFGGEQVCIDDKKDKVEFISVCSKCWLSEQENY